MFQILKLINGTIKKLIDGAGGAVLIGETNISMQWFGDRSDENSLTQVFLPILW